MVPNFLMMRIVRLLLCIVGLFVLCHKTQNRSQSRCDVGLHICKYNGPTAKTILFIYVKSHRVTFCEKASFRQLALVLLSGDVALNPGPMKFGIEQIVAAQIRSHMDFHDLGNTFQSAYKVGHSKICSFRFLIIVLPSINLRSISAIVSHMTPLS